MGAACQWPSRHAPHPDWLPGAALLSRRAIRVPRVRPAPVRARLCPKPPRRRCPEHRAAAPRRHSHSPDRARRGHLPRATLRCRAPSSSGQVHTDAGRQGEHNHHLSSHRAPSSAEVQHPPLRRPDRHFSAKLELHHRPLRVGHLHVAAAKLHTGTLRPPSSCPTSAAIFPKLENASTDNRCRAVLAPPSEALR
jgi:hypothetical protein